MDIPLDEVIHVEAISSSSTGAAADADSTPTFAVYEESTDTDVGVGGNMTKRTSLTGNYRASFTASAANGFDVGKWYSVIGSATIGGIATKGVLARFRIVAAEATAGYPVTTHKVGTGTGELSTSSGVVKADDFNGNHLLYLDYYDSYTRLTSGTVAAGAAGTVTLAAGASSVDDFYKGRAISIISGTGVGQTRVCTAYNGTTKVATISPNWATNPSAGATYYIGLLDASSVPQTGDCFARLTGTGAVTFASLDVSGATTLSGAVTASNASNDVRGIRISSGTGTGQLDVTSGRIKADTVYFGGSAGSFTTGVPSVNTTLISGSLVSTSTAQLGVNVVNFGGSAGTFASGRPEVNASHWGGTAVASANVRANLIQIGGDTQSGTDLKDFVDTGYDPAAHKVAGVVLVDTLTTYTGNTPQTGDAYAIVNSGTYGNSALKTEVLAVQSALVTIFNDTDELQQDWANGGRLDLLVDSIIATLGSAGAGLTGIPKTGYKLASDGLDSVLVEAVISASAALVNDSGTQLTSINGRQALALILAAAAAKLSGAEGATLDLKPAGKPSASSRVTATCDTDGNRTPTTVRVPD